MGAVVISVITYSHDRQEMFDITLPKWGQQKDVEYEVIAGHGPGVTVPDNIPNVRGFRVSPERYMLSRANNEIIAQAKGDILLLTQSDMEVNDPYQLKRMLDKWHERLLLTERFFKDGVRDAGVHLQFMMVSKAAVLKVGGFCELYDSPDSCAHEDGDLVCSLMEQGLHIEHIETPADIGVYHIDHPRPDYLHDERVLKRLEVGRNIYNSRHKFSLPIMLMRQKYGARIIK